MTLLKHIYHVLTVLPPTLSLGGRMAQASASPAVSLIGEKTKKKKVKEK